MNKRKVKIEDLPMAIIVGSPRSGTSMLRTFFDAHSQVQIPTEFPFFPFLYDVYRNKPFEEYIIDSYIARIRFTIQHQFWNINRWNIDFESLKKSLLEAGNLRFAGVCKHTVASFKSVFNKRELSLLMLKEPLYTYYLNKIYRIFPDVKVIAIERDPRAQVNSIRNFKFGSRLITANALAWRKAQQKIASFQKKNQNKTYIIKYDQLVQDPEKELTRLCEFLCIPFEKDMLNYHLWKDDILKTYGFETIGMHPSIKSTMQKPDVSKILEWKEALSKREIQLIETVNYRGMKRRGYIPQYKQNYFLFLLYIPVYIHGLIQTFLSYMVKVLPPSRRIKIIFSPSLFERTYGRIFGKKTRK